MANLSHNSPMVSVVMSVYNDEPYVAEAVRSILGQTFRNFEFIIINDGSTDQTGEILASFHDERIRLLNQDNRGLTFSLNRGLSLARGQFIARMDGDDISLPERFARELAFLDENPEIGLVGTFAYRIDIRGRRVDIYRYPTTPAAIRDNLRSDCPFCHTSVMFRRACIEKVGPYRERIGPAEDLDLWLRINEYFDAANLPEALHSFRIDPYGITVQRRLEQLRASCLARKMAGLRIENGKDPLDKWTEDELKRVLDALLPITPELEKQIRLTNALYLADVFYVTDDFRNSWSWLARYLRERPCDRKGWTLMGKLFVKRVLPRRWLKALRAGRR